MVVSSSLVIVLFLLLLCTYPSFGIFMLLRWRFCVDSFDDGSGLWGTIG